MSLSIYIYNDFCIIFHLVVYNFEQLMIHFNINLNVYNEVAPWLLHYNPSQQNNNLVYYNLNNLMIYIAQLYTACYEHFVYEYMLPFLCLVLHRSFFSIQLNEYSYCMKTFCIVLLLSNHFEIYFCEYRL